MDGFRMNVGTHICDLIEIVRFVNPENLDRDVATLMFALPNVSIPAAIQRGI